MPTLGHHPVPTGSELAFQQDEQGIPVCWRSTDLKYYCLHFTDENTKPEGTYVTNDSPITLLDSSRAPFCS